MMFDIKTATKKILEGCVIPSASGVAMLTPDGQRNYAALWTRDFAYMMENAGELIPLDQAGDCLEYILTHVDTNGWVPDKVQAEGTPFYTAGAGVLEAGPNLDNGQFLIIAADCYLKRLSREEAKAFFSKWEKVLLDGIDCLPKDGNGLIVNSAAPPHSPYGFTDTVCKTGALAMETLLLWHSIKLLLFWQNLFSTESEKLAAIKAGIEKHFLPAFAADCGMLYAASDICRQIDVWASCFMLAIGFPITKEDRTKILEWLKKNYDGVIFEGQMRQLPAGEYWEKTFVPVPENTYQNGAFWATPIIWFIKAMKDYDFALAEKTLGDVLNYFEKYGIFECVYQEDRKLDTYVASATNVFGAAKALNMA